MTWAIREDQPQKGNPLLPLPSKQFQQRQPVLCQLPSTVFMRRSLRVEYSFWTCSSCQQFFLQALSTRQLMGIQTAPLQQLSSVPQRGSDRDSDLIPSQDIRRSGSIMISTAFFRASFICSLLYSGNSLFLIDESQLLCSQVNSYFFQRSSIFFLRFQPPLPPEYLRNKVSSSEGQQMDQSSTPVKKGKRFMQPTLVTNLSINSCLAFTTWSLKRKSAESRHSSNIFFRMSSFFLWQQKAGLLWLRYRAMVSSPSEKKYIQDIRSTCCLDNCHSPSTLGQSSRPLPIKLPLQQSSLHLHRYLVVLFIASFSIRLLWL